MGTETRYLNIAAIVSEQELFSRWRTMQEDDEHQRGVDPYNGALTQARLHVSSKFFKTYKEAVKFSDSAELDKGEAVAYKYGEKPGFPKTKADVELVAKIASMQKELDSFDIDILKRFVESKSSSKKCTHCDSVISKKSRAQHAALQTKFSKVRDRFYDGDEGTSCPACGGNLLVTDTDKKRLDSLTKRHREAVDKRDKLLAAAKKNSPAWGYYIVAAVPS